MPADATQLSSGPTRRRAHVPFVPDRDALRAGKAAAALRRGPSSGGPGGAAANAVVVGGLNQPGLGATDNSLANQGTPPDTTGAIGTTHYVEFVNSKVGVYSRSTLGLVSSRDLDAFTGRAGQNVFDPQIQWDSQGGRWLYVADDIDGAGNNFLAFGWSKTADPSDLVGGWCRFALSTDVGGSRFLEDYPKLGHDNVHIIIGSNSFRGNSFFTAHVFSIAEARERRCELHGAVGRDGIRLAGQPAYDVRRRHRLYPGPREHGRQRRGGSRGRGRLAVLRREPEPGDGLARRRQRRLARARPGRQPERRARSRFRQTCLSPARRT